MGNRYVIVGTNFTGVAESFVAGLKAGTPAVLVREPDNPHDANAVAVYVEGKRVGYIRRKDNPVLAQFIDQSGHWHIGEGGLIAQDGALSQRKAIDGTFVRSPNSGFPMVEV